jgi:hypothetical protein
MQLIGEESRSPAKPDLFAATRKALAAADAMVTGETRRHTRNTSSQ